MTLVEIETVDKDYTLGRTVVHALKSVSLTIAAGEFTAVWGPSGSGKTTLLNLVGAIDRQTRGTVRLKGESLSGLSDNRLSELRNRTIGFVFQGFNLVPVLSALENVMLPLQIRGVSRSEAKKQALSRLGDVSLGHVIGHRPDQLSGGQRQRVSIARALVGSPALVIADEPTANLDSGTARDIIGLMHDLNTREKTTFVFSTHDQRLLDRVERLIRLEDGTIINGGN
ncbi:MAG: ABC transporter ATP-binding protein [Pseudomonadota bacterium]